MENDVKSGEESITTFNISQRIINESSRLAESFNRVVEYGIKSERIWNCWMKRKLAYFKRECPTIQWVIQKEKKEFWAEVEKNPLLLDEIDQHSEVIEAIKKNPTTRHYSENRLQTIYEDIRKHPKLLYLYKEYREALGWLVFSIIVLVLSSLCYLVLKVFTDPIVSGDLWTNVTPYIVWSNVIPYIFILVSLFLFRIIFMKPKIKEADQLNDVFQKIDKKLRNSSTWYSLSKDLKEEMNHHLSLFVVGLEQNAGNSYSRQIHSVYKICRTKEEERLSRIVDGSRRRLVRIVRLGIIGTFWGLLTSFYLSALTLKAGVKEIDMLIGSLSGYALAVLSSIAANVISILYEIGRIKSVRGNDEVLSWIDAVYNEFLLHPPFHPAIATIPEKVIADIMQSSTEIKSLFDEIRDAVKESANEVKKKGDEAKKSTDDLTALVKNVKIITNSFTKIMSNDPEKLKETYPDGNIPAEHRGLIDDSINFVKNVKFINIQGDAIIKAIEESNITGSVANLETEVKNVIAGLNSAVTVLNQIEIYAENNKLMELKTATADILDEMKRLRRTWRSFLANLFSKKRVGRGING